jgi:hypothetical protein
MHRPLTIAPLAMNILSLKNKTSHGGWAHLRCFVVFAGSLAISLLAHQGFADDAVPTDPPLRYYKGNIHTHSLWSDGNDFPEMIAEWYRTHGYNFLALSDHNVLSAGTRWMKLSEIIKRGGTEVAALEKYQARFGGNWVETRGTPDTEDFAVRLKPLNEFRSLVEERGRFIMLQGEEISDRAAGKPLHMNATNLRDVIQPSGGKTIREAMEANLRAVEDQARRTGRETLVHLNHPNFGWGVSAEDLAAVLQERFFEVYNGHPGVRHQGDDHHPSVERLWDIANTIRLGELQAAPLFGVATDDSHHYLGKGESPKKGRSESRTGRGWIQVRSHYLTPESIIRSMKAGDFYASSGVELTDVSFDADAGLLALTIASKPGVTYTTQFIGTPIEYRNEPDTASADPGEADRSDHRDTPEIGKVFATVSGPNPQYKLTGNELYVRAVVTSDQRHADPSYAGQQKQAWTQPVGWRQRPPARPAIDTDATKPETPVPATP